MTEIQPSSVHKGTDRKMIAIQVDTSTGWGRRLLMGVFKYKSQQPTWDVWTCPKSFAEFQHLPQGIRFDGAVVYIGNARQARGMARYGIPVINASVFDSEPFGIPNIPPDPNTPINLAFDFFRKRGYRSYAYCGPTSLSFVRSYGELFMKRVRDAGFAGTLLNVNARNFHGQLKALPVPTAIFAWPRTVYQLLAACHALNMPIPEDYPILAQDEDDILNRLCSPPLSAIQVPAEQIGYEAGRLLHLLMEGKPLPSERQIPKPRDIIERQSTNALAIEDSDIRTALHFIRNNSHRPCSVDEIAELAGLSRRTLERRFRKFFGRTIAEELQSIRLEKARFMLNTTDLPVADIAPRCGFSSAEYFIYVFRRVHHMTPAVFRKQGRPGQYPRK